MTRTCLLLLALWPATAAAGPIGFSGDFAPANWKTTNQNSNGTVNSSGAPGSITITGPANGTKVSGSTAFTLAAPFSLTVSFSWSYSTADAAPSLDPLAFLFGQVAVTLTDPSGPKDQSGTFSAKVPGGLDFGFQVGSFDNLKGEGQATISDLDVTAGPVTPGFSGPYDPTRWVPVLENSNGVVDAGDAPSFVTLVGPDNDSGDAGLTGYTITIPADGVVAFDWTYATKDDPGYDPFGVVHNGTFQVLTDPKGGNFQSGSFSTPVHAGDSFGLVQGSGDNKLGRGQTTVYNFSGPTAAEVPEPSSLTVFGVILAGAAGYFRRWRPVPSHPSPRGT